MEEFEAELAKARGTGPRPLPQGAPAANPRPALPKEPLDQKQFDTIINGLKAGPWSEVQNLAYGATLSIPHRALSFARAITDVPDILQVSGPGLGARFQARDAAQQQAIAKYDAENPWAPIRRMLAAVPATIGAATITPGLAAMRGTGAAGRVTANILEGAEAGALMTPVTGGELGQNTGIGALAGGGLGVAGAGTRGVIGALLRGTIDPEVAAMARRASELGLDLRPGQISMSRMVQRLDNWSSKGGNAAQVDDFNDALARVVGGEGRLTEDVLTDAMTRADAALDAAAARTFLNVDQPYLDAWNDIGVLINTLEPEAQSVLRPMMQHLQPPAGANPMMDGMTYQRLTRYSSQLSSLTRSRNANVREAAIMMRDMLDGALERSVGADELEAVRDARGLWRNAMVLDNAMAHVGSNQITGQIDPKVLASAVKTTTRRLRFGDPDADLRVLGQAGLLLPSPSLQGGVKETPGFGAKVKAGLGVMGGALGGTAAAAAMGAPGAANMLIGAGIGAAAPSGLRRGIENVMASPATAQATGLRPRPINLRPNALLPPLVGEGQRRREAGRK